MTPTAPNNEAQLVQRLVAGEKAAFTHIYRTYAQELIRFTRRTVSRSEDAEEIVQEVFESLWVRHAALGHITSLKSYLYSAVRYKIIRYISHQQVRRRYEEHYKLFEAAYDTLPVGEQPPEAVTANILQALEGLPSRCQMAMRLRLTENLTNTEIAARMGISKDTVENYIVKAVAHLKSLGTQVLKGN